MSENIRTFIVSETDAGQRLDKFLAARMPEFSRSEIQKFCITRGGGRARLSDRVKVGAEYQALIPDLKPFDASGLAMGANEDIRLDILYEDDAIIVVNKPRGIAMHPGAGRDSGTLVQSVCAHTNLSNVGIKGGRPGVVHRLDKDTSGIVVFAKTDMAHRKLFDMFAQHNMVKKYIAFVWGVPNWESADITGNIARSSRNRQKMTLVKRGGKEARTEAEVVHVWGSEKISELRCTLYTGRTHQIRVHLSAHGFPVLNDPVYGRGAARLGSVKNPELLEFLKTRQGQMLHAEVLEFAHPMTGAALRFKAGLPDDMRELKEILSK